jgi:hypothetical protein
MLEKCKFPRVLEYIPAHPSHSARLFHRVLVPFPIVFIPTLPLLIKRRTSVCDFEWLPVSLLCYSLLFPLCSGTHLIKDTWVQTRSRKA